MLRVLVDPTFGPLSSIHSLHLCRWPSCPTQLHGLLRRGAACGGGTAGGTGERDLTPAVALPHVGVVVGATAVAVAAHNRDAATRRVCRATARVRGGHRRAGAACSTGCVGCSRRCVWGTGVRRVMMPSPRCHVMIGHPHRRCAALAHSPARNFSPAVPSAYTAALARRPAIPDLAPRCRTSATAGGASSTGSCHQAPPCRHAR